MAETSVIILGLPDLPEDNIPPNLWDNFLQVHRAIKNLLAGVSRYSGIDAPESTTWSSLSYSDTILTANLSRMYPRATVGITAGQVVYLYSNAGVLEANLASANSATTLAHGIAMTSALAGQQFEMYFLRGLVNTIGGMVLGTLYYLSPTPGAIQNIAPTAPGTIRQPIGVALTTSQLLFDSNLSYHQN